MYDYEKDGFYIAKSAFSKDFIQDLLDYLSTLESKITLPFTNVVWGYGSLLDKGPFSKVPQNEVVAEFCKFVLGDEYIFNHLFVHNKVQWIGPSIEWHQEVFNIDSFAPGYSKKEWKNFIQVYVALEKQDLDNGCIKVFPGSHKEGILPFEDAVNEHFSHKRRVPFEKIEMLYKKYGLKNCELEPGDILFFNHLLVHGSASNASNRSRKSIVLQVRKNIRKKDNDIFEKESKYRINFVINSLKDRINSLKNIDLYGEQGREKK